ncbi:MAG: hypothetical protein ACI4J2_09100 [Ruminococcus sp.]
MNRKRIIAGFLACLMGTAALTGCNKNSGSESSDSVVEPAPINVEGLEEPAVAQSGDAYLAIVDGRWWIQYWGKDEEDGLMLAYGAENASITGDGDYTVKITTDTKGFRYKTTGSVYGSYTPSGCSFAAIIVKDGTTKFPNMSIVINSIKVNGKEIPLKTKNYTSSDDGVEMRTNIFNEWVSTPPLDAHSPEGSVAGSSDYSSVIIDRSAFDEGWTDVEVSFTVTDTGLS